MSRSSIGQLVMLAGVALVIIGALIWAGALSWFGRLPGDLRVERPGVRVYVPLVSMLLLSLGLSLLAVLVRRLWP